MPWMQNKKLKLRFFGKNKDHIVIFEISEEKRAEFYKILEYFLAGVKTNEGVVTSCEEQLDSETNEAIELELKIIGSPEKMMQMMNQYGPELTKVAVSVKQS